MVDINQELAPSEDQSYINWINSIGMILWLGYSVTIALYALTFGLYTSEAIHKLSNINFFDAHNNDLINGRKVLAFISIFSFMIVNLRGVKETGSIQNLIVLFKLSVLFFIGLLGLIFFNQDSYSPFTNKTDPLEITTEDIFGGFSGIVIGAAVIFISYEAIDLNV